MCTGAEGEAAAKTATEVAGEETTAGEVFATQAADDAAMGAAASGGAATGGAASGIPGALKVAKDVAPLVAAGASVVGAGAGVQAAKSASDRVSSLSPAATPAVPASVIDPDLTAIRKRNAVLFGIDSPNATDLTKGKAAVGDLGRATLLGGTSTLGS